MTVTLTLLLLCRKQSKSIIFFVQMSTVKHISNQILNASNIPAPVKFIATLYMATRMTTIRGSAQFPPRLLATITQNPHSILMLMAR